MKSIREAYAARIRETAGIRSAAVISALAKVPREDFLGPGPWQIYGLDHAGPALTEDADPSRVYQNASIAIDRERDLYNGQPGLVGSWLDSLSMIPGNRVLHIGCGTGYYSAVIAEIVGSEGHVHAIEVDADLATRARSNLTRWPWVEVSHSDGRSGLPSDVDVVLVHAGSTHVLAAWLDSTREGARVMVPLTVSVPAMSPSLSKGMVLLATRIADAWTAQLSSFVAIYSLIGLRDEAMNHALGQAFRAGPGGTRVSRIRRDPHVPSDTCWLHGECCISR